MSKPLTDNNGRSYRIQPWVSGSAWMLTIARDGDSRCEVWPTREALEARLQCMGVKP